MLFRSVLFRSTPEARQSLYRKSAEIAKLSKVDGVSFAAVNLATDSAFVVLERPVPREVLERAVREAGYDIGSPPGEGREEERYRAARHGVIFSWAVVVPLMVLMVLHMYGGAWAHAGAMSPRRPSFRRVVCPCPILCSNSCSCSINPCSSHNTSAVPRKARRGSMAEKKGSRKKSIKG